MKNLIAVIIFMCGALSINAQNIKIGNDNTTAHPSSILELNGNMGGFEVPELTATQITALRTGILSLPIAEIAEALGMMIYQTDGKAGLYFFDGQDFVKYSPHGLIGKVGGSYSETFPSVFTFESTPAGLGYSTSQLGVGDYQIDFDASNYFQNYPIITITPENQKIALSEDLPIPDVTCTPSFFANCSADFNSDQVEAVRVESYVDIDGGGPGPIEMQVLQNGEGFLPPTGANGCDIWPYPDNDCNSGSTWMGTGLTAGIGAHPGSPVLNDYDLQLIGGPWGPVTDCVLQVADPCIIQDGGGNYGKYWPDANISANTYCNNIYHPADQSANQAGQLTIRLGKGSGDYFKIWMESSRQWADDMAAWIDWNRDGDFTDPGEGLGAVPEPFCAGQGSGTTSLCSGPAQLPVDAGAMGTGNAGEFIVPPSADLGLTTLRVMSVWAASNLLNFPCNVTTWGETEDYVVEIYDADVGSVIGLGGDFVYNPVVCTIEEVMQSGIEYSGFKVSCQDVTGSPVDTKVHWDATESTFY